MFTRWPDKSKKAREKGSPFGPLVCIPPSFSKPCSSRETRVCNMMRVWTRPRAPRPGRRRAVEVLGAAAVAASIQKGEGKPSRLSSEIKELNMTCMFKSVRTICCKFS